MHYAKMLHMGWLRDQMSSVDVPITSFGELARRALASEKWPAELDVKERSLSSLFSKFDREIELDWLVDRPAVQEVLAEIFDRPVSDIRAAIGPAHLPSSPHLFRFHEARYARDFNLLREDLPPGLPSYWADPYEWQQLHVRSEIHEGIELLAQMLERRGRAQVLRLDERRPEELPLRAPLLLLASEEASLRSWLPRIEARSTERPLLLISPSIPPRGFQSIQAPEVSEYLFPLAEWLQERLDPSGNFEAERATAWVRTELAPRQPHWAEVLSALAAFDELPPRKTKGVNLASLAEALVSQRLREVAERTSWGPRMRSQAWYRMTLAISRRPSMSSAASLEEWGNWLARGSKEQDYPSLDQDWIESALGDALGKKLSQRELTRAARRLDPSGYQLARALLSTRLLRPLQRTHETELYELYPSFVARALCVDAAQLTLDIGAEDWGDALLRTPHLPLRAELVRRAQQFDESGAATLEEDYEEDSPGATAALEAFVGIYLPAAFFRSGNLEDFISDDLSESLAEHIARWQSAQGRLHDLAPGYFCLPTPTPKTATATAMTANPAQLGAMPGRHELVLGQLLFFAARGHSSELSPSARAWAEEALVWTLRTEATLVPRASESLLQLLLDFGLSYQELQTTFLNEKPNLGTLLALARLHPDGPERSEERVLTWLAGKGPLQLTELQQSPFFRRFVERMSEAAVSELEGANLEATLPHLLPHQLLIIFRSRYQRAQAFPAQLLQRLSDHTIELELQALLSEQALAQAPLSSLLQFQGKLLLRTLIKLPGAQRAAILENVFQLPEFSQSGITLLQSLPAAKQLAVWPPEALAALKVGLRRLTREFGSTEAFQLLRTIERSLAPRARDTLLKDYS